MSATVPVFVLVAIMLFTGSMNTILNKYQNLQCLDNCDDPDESKRHTYNQPVWQTVQMFVGEALCLAVFYYGMWFNKKASPPTPTSEEASGPYVIPEGTTAPVPPATVVAVDETSPLRPNQDEAPKKLPLDGRRAFLLWIPTLCDMTATTLMSYISASIYQMLRGSVVLFTGGLSTIFLGRRHPAYRWFALSTVFLGVSLVGASTILDSGGSDTSSKASPLAPLGVLLVVMAQTITASQFVIEEIIMAKYDIPPLQAVGLEGIFGLLSALILMPLLYFTYGKNGPKGNFFDLPVGFEETISHRTTGPAFL
ncbi:hypothetical protein HDU96_004665 [Phlyctochytrium bullatum]|nr:hypothetical protein HDU96_004665 [Phlyctochytrium bullatum]